MTSRRADFDVENEPQSKRLRRCGDAGTHATSPSLESVNDDCLLLILSFLPVDDLNSIAICNRRFQKTRAHESLDQTRKGTIIISEGSTFESIVDSITRNGWNSVFQGNRTHLEIVGLENLGEIELGITRRQIARRVKLARVTRLDLKVSPNRPISHNVMQLLTLLVPGVEEMDFGDLIVSRAGEMYNNVKWGNPTKVTWNRCDQAVWTGGISKLCYSSEFTELYYDNACFLALDDEDIDKLTSWHICFYLFSSCRSLAKLSIKRATIKKKNDSHGEAQPVTQDMLIKMVRRHPTLRWLRSDLSAENIAMLKEERPEITFVSE